MQILLLLDPTAGSYNVVQPDLVAEINALATKDVRVSTKSAPPPAGTLVADQVFQFIIDHVGGIAASVALAKALIELAVTVINRRAGGGKDKPVLVVIQDRRLALPSSSETQKRFLKAVTEDLELGRPHRPPPNKKTSKGRKPKKNSRK